MIYNHVNSLIKHLEEFRVNNICLYPFLDLNILIIEHKSIKTSKTPMTHFKYLQSESNRSIANPAYSGPAAMENLN